MFLGWISNVLLIGFVQNHIRASGQRPFQLLFGGLQIFIAGMLISFPLQGYGAISIVLSTLHTVTVCVFATYFFLKTSSENTVSAWFARASLVFFIVSSAGPFFLGYLMANDLGHTNWYYFSIYFYLHFQYNGFFLFGLFSLIARMLEKRKPGFNLQQLLKAGKILAIACVPAYCLSVLWAQPHPVFNFVGGAAAAAQVTALYLIVNMTRESKSIINNTFSKSSRTFLKIVLIAFGIKIVLQLLSAWPAIAQLAYAFRPVVIAYLHLVLLGVISLGLLVWYCEEKLLRARLSKFSLSLFTCSFVLMEVCLVASSWWSALPIANVLPANYWNFASAVLLSVSCWMILVSGITSRPEIRM